MRADALVEASTECLVDIFNADDPGPAEGQDNPTAPGGTTIDDYVYRLNEVKATKLAGGSIKTADSTNFKISQTIAAAEVEIMPGGMRELHWHPNSDEWDYFISGEYRAGQPLCLIYLSRI